MAEGGRSRHADPYPEHLLASRGKHGDRYPDYEPTETGRARGPVGGDTERVLRSKERPARPPLPQSLIERDKTWDRKRDRQHDRDRGRDLELERHMGKEQRRDREQDLRGVRAGGKDGERSRERGLSGDRQRERDRQIQKDKDRQRVRTRSMERGLEEEPGRSRDWPREGRASCEEHGDDGERERRAGTRQRVQSGPEEVFDDPEEQGGVPGRERSQSRANGETGTTLSHPLGSAGVFVWCAGFAFLLWQSQVVGCSNIVITKEDTNFLSVFMRMTTCPQ